MPVLRMTTHEAHLVLAALKSRQKKLRKRVDQYQSMYDDTAIDRETRANARNHELFTRERVGACAALIYRIDQELDIR